MGKRSAKFDVIDDYEPFDDVEVEGTHNAMDHHGVDIYATAVDKLMSMDAMGFDVCGAMAAPYGDGGSAY